MDSRRFAENPLIHPGLSPEIGTNINGPSAPACRGEVARPLGHSTRFAHHQGTFIRMAYADDVRGPWTVYPGGVLRLDETACREHIASPDVHVLPEQRRIVMYFHGLRRRDSARSGPRPSGNGLHFAAERTILGPFYFRAFYP
ncbi:MAG: hypothetical protein R2838_09135 [Caldilineaceae bacterium]